MSNKPSATIHPKILSWAECFLNVSPKQKERESDADGNSGWRQWLTYTRGRRSFRHRKSLERNTWSNKEGEKGILSAKGKLISVLISYVWYDLSWKLSNKGECQEGNYGQIPTPRTGSIYKLLEKLYNFDFIEIHKKTEKEAKREASWILDRDMGTDRFGLFFFY
jgi:hypothetical protein